MIECAARYTLDTITETMLKIVTLNPIEYYRRVILFLFVWIKSKNRLEIIVATLIDVALGQPY